MSRIGVPSRSARQRSSPARPARDRWPRARRACRGGPAFAACSMRFSTTRQVGQHELQSSRSMSRQRIDGAVGMRHRPGPRTRAPRGAARRRCAAAPAGRPGSPRPRAPSTDERRRGQVDVGHVGRHLALGLEQLGEPGQPLVGHLDDADVDGHAAEAAGLGVAPGERVEDGRLAATGQGRRSLPAPGQLVARQ